MAVPMVRRLWTVDEYHRLAEEDFFPGERLELIRGEIIQRTRGGGHQRRLLTLDEYHQMIEAGILSEDERIELIRGELIEMSPIGKRHAACVRLLNHSFVSRLTSRAQVDVQNPMTVETQQSEPQPDVTLLRYREDWYRTQLPTPEDVLLVVEVADSSLANDRDVKIPLYAAAGIREAWLVAFPSDSVFSYRDPSPTGYRMVREYRRGDVIAPEAFPDERFTVDEILG
jgi:Uma2 family endonuclease